MDRRITQREVAHVAGVTENLVRNNVRMLCKNLGIDRKKITRWDRTSGSNSKK